MNIGNLTSNEMSLEKMVGNIGKRTDLATSNLSNSLSSDNASPKNMLELQVQLQMWNTAVQLETSVIKAIGDALKSIVQKMN